MKNIKLETLISNYELLPYTHKRVLLIRTLLYKVNTKAELLDCLRDSLISASDKKFTHSILNKYLTYFHQFGLMDFSGRITESMIHFLTKEAVEIDGCNRVQELTGTLFKMKKIIIKDSNLDIVHKYMAKRASGNNSFNFEKSYPNNPPGLRELYVAVYENDEEFFLDKLQDKSNDEFYKLINLFSSIFYKMDINDSKWIESRNIYIQSLFFYTKLGYIYRTATILCPDISFWTAFYLQQKFSNYPLKMILCFYEIDLALGLFDAHKYDKLLSNSELGRNEIKAVNCFFNSDFQESIKLFEANLKIQNKILGSSYCSEGIDTVIIILIYLMNSSTQSKANQVLKKLTNRMSDVNITQSLNAIYTLLYGNHETSETIFKLMITFDININFNYLSVILRKLLEYLLYPSRVSADSKNNFAMFSLYEQNHLFLQAHFYAELVLSENPDNEKCTEFLQIITPFPKFRFLNLLKPKEEWEYKLDSLISLVTTNNTVSGKIEADEKRLIWYFNPTSFSLTPIEQKVLKNGKWSKGRNIALSRLYKRDEKLDYFTPKDWTVVGAGIIENKEWYSYGPDYYFDYNKAIPALIGHPAVYLESDHDIHIELVKGYAELKINEAKGYFSISLSQHDTKTGIIVKKETENRYQVISYDNECVKLAELLSKSGLRIPSEQKDKIVSILKNSSEKFHIHSNIADKRIPIIKGNPTPILHLIPMKDGLKVNLLVRPLGRSGFYSRPAHGDSNTIVTSVDKKGKETRKNVKRNKKTEKELSEIIIKSISLLADANSGSDEWIFDEIKDCLELLCEIEQFSKENKLTVEWPKGESLKFKQSITEKNLSLKIKGSQDWFEYSGDIKFDDGLVVDLKYILDHLNSDSSRFIQLENKHYIALTDKLKKQLSELKSVSEKNRVHFLNTKFLRELSEESEEKELDDIWKQHINNLQKQKRHNPKIPSTLQAELRDYQQDGFKFMSKLANWGIGGCLADDMGLGKTVQSIALLLEKASKGPALVIAPTSVCFNWLDELNRFAPTLKPHYLASSNNRTKLIKSLSKMDVLVTSYGILQVNEEILCSKKWETVILDEAQAIKNPNTKRWKAAVKLSGRNRFALTGTPIENHLGELWSIFKFLNPGQLGSANLFKQRFLTPIENDRNSPVKRTLKTIITPFVLRRLKSDVLSELPPKTEQTIVIEPSAKEMAFYEAVRTKAKENINKINTEGSGNRFSILAEITKLRQACCHSCLVDDKIDIENGKIKTFLTILERLKENNHKTLVFSQYVRFLNIIKKELQSNGFTFQYIDGSTPPKNRKKAVEDFQNGEGDLFLLSLKAGGTGLNLTAADYVIHLDPWWNPAVEDQASDRAHRIGQDRPVTIYRLIMKNTIEEKIIALHKNKRNLAADILGGTDIASKISEEELLKLINY